MEDEEDDEYDDDQFHSFQAEENWEEIDEEDTAQLEYYHQHHPDLMLALDYHNQFGHRLDQRILEQDERLNRGSFDHS